MISDSVKPPESISALRALVGNRKRALQCFGFAQIVQTLCDSRAQFFQKLHTRQSEIHLVDPPKFPFESAEMSV